MLKRKAVVEALTVSEELKQKAREFVKEWNRNLWQDAGFLLPDLASESAAEYMAEFASQVCEQREKGYEQKAASLGAVMGSLGIKAHRLGSEISYTNERAEAAELALQTYRDDFQNREAAVCPEDVGFEEYIASLKKALQAAKQDYADLAKEMNSQLAEHMTLKAALQAKEQELREIATALQCTDEFDEHRDVVTRAREVVTELAQARQQAIADLKPFLKHSLECVWYICGKCNGTHNFNIADHEYIHSQCDCGLDKARSLTPPPALTHTLGGADEPKECQHGYVRGECLEGCK